MDGGGSAQFGTSASGPAGDGRTGRRLINADPTVRARRVTVLVLAIAALGLADLLLTLTHMRTTGLFEANPIARFMIEVGGERQLVVFKLFSLALSGGVLYLMRTRRSAEMCAWVCTAVLVALIVYWAVYDGVLMDLAPLLHPEAAAVDPRWVFLGDAAP